MLKLLCFNCGLYLCSHNLTGDKSLKLAVENKRTLEDFYPKVAESGRPPYDFIRSSSLSIAHYGQSDACIYMQADSRKPLV